jgi:hypothetical protein
MKEGTYAISSSDLSNPISVSRSPCGLRIAGRLQGRSRRCSKSVETLVERACLTSDIVGKRSQWLTYRIPLRPAGSVYFVQCTFPASNDVHTVVLEDAGGEARLATFGHKIHDVFNARWDERNQIIMDISGSGAGCAHERRWKWNGRNFTLVSRRVLGCQQ